MATTVICVCVIFLKLSDIKLAATPIREVPRNPTPDELKRSQQNFLEVRGTVVLEGGSKKKFMIHPESSTKTKSQPINGCTNASAFAMVALSGNEFYLRGYWQTIPPEKSSSSQQETCFYVTDYVLEKLSNGRKPYIGILKTDKAGQYYLDDGGKIASPTLSNPPSGLKHYKNQKVILDLKQLNRPGINKENWVIVNYWKHP